MKSYDNIILITDSKIQLSEQRHYGQMRVIPLLIKKFRIENFTFNSSYYFKNPLFQSEDLYFKIEKENFLLLNDNYIDRTLNSKSIDHICQIISQNTEYNSNYNITFQILKYAMRNTDFKYYLVVDDLDFRLNPSFKDGFLKKERRLIENVHIRNIYEYDKLIEEFIDSMDLPMNALRITKNLFLLEAYESYYKKKNETVRRLRELFNFTKIRFKDYPLWVFLENILQNYHKKKNEAIAKDKEFNLGDFLDNNKLLRPLIDDDLTNVVNNIADFLTSIEFDINNLRDHYT